ncbi:MAG: hypothetical protein CVU04_04780 [Bacteroidetes bacterium HGW-Bacteroidetes-20]|nr:MAG: hypothetical protein CVU04_04780 [Bacteroidetes bacterium HGW-Bacteroidetes-20]
MDVLSYQLQILATKYILNPVFILFLVKKTDKMPPYLPLKNKKKKKISLPPQFFNLFLKNS